ncbi:hypothetical protein SAMN04489740_4094 [Arthrobacter alpinus]|uniref:Uncharacterized protein n=1 Tax=Arthrobacter alpinus TaxID=656366 RepID=A0A1H5PBW6_9MICC|nr:peptidase [Arthrobacter alpinus]SEF11349.1 hypothetical protein SAMN04489740_4094 [Arthrobacter alpinus]
MVPKPVRRVESAPAGQGMLARIPGHGSFTLTGEAVAMIGIFGGLLHCYLGPSGCRKQGLYFSRTEPKKPLRCLLSALGDAGSEGAGGLEEIVVSVSHDLAPKLNGAVLDFDTYNKMQRFAWQTMPAVKGPACTCLRSIGPAAGKHSPCLDDQGIGLSDFPGK